MRFTYSAVAAIVATFAVPAHANRIHTGGETGAYHRDFCPTLVKEMVAIGQAYQCTPSSGTLDNIQKVRASPREFGFGQLDVFAMQGTQTTNVLQIVRQDDARECVFAVTKNPDITSFGELSAYATSTRFVLPPQTSGSAGTFQFLRTLDRNGLGRVSTNSIRYAAGTDDAIREALRSPDGVAFFVQYPDPDNERFKLVRDLGGHFVPVIDRVILDRTVGGRFVYTGQETRVANGRRVAGISGRVTTACTPIVLFTGADNRVDSGERRQHIDAVQAVKAFGRDAVLPRQTPLRQAMEKTRELTAEGRERLLAYSYRARDQALPFFRRMIERAAPRSDSLAFGGSSRTRDDDRE